jgi:hypothetical protein
MLHLRIDRLSKRRRNNTIVVISIVEIDIIRDDGIAAVSYRTRLYALDFYALPLLSDIRQVLCCNLEKQARSLTKISIKKGK